MKDSPVSGGEDKEKIVKAFAILSESEDCTMDVIRCLGKNGIGCMINLTGKKNEVCVYMQSAEKAEKVLKDNGFVFSTRDYDMFSMKEK